jgi:hypothetical protein
MEQFLTWVRFLSTSKYFIWAKIWAGICALLLTAMSLFASQGNWGWVASLLFVFCIAVSSAFEALALAFEEATATAAPLYGAGLLLHPQAAEEEQEVEPQSLAAAADGEPQPQKPIAQEPPPQAELTEEAKLSLCQYYTFLYGVVRYKMVGEGTWSRLGMSATKYRLWLVALAQPQLRVVDTSKGRTAVIEEDLRAAMQRISNYKQDPTYWQFPLKVYANLDNWKDHASYKVNGEEASLLMPIFPKTLQDLNLGSN